MAIGVRAVGEGRAPHARKEGITPNPNVAPFRPPACRKTTGGNAMPCHSSGRTVRTRRGHPSDKTAFRVVPRSPRKAISPRTVHPRRGGLRTPGRNGWVWPRHVGIGPRATGLPRSCNETPRHALGLAMRTRRAHPSEKTPLVLSPGVSPQGHLPLGGPPRGGAGSARPLGAHGLDQNVAPLGHRVFLCPR